MDLTWALEDVARTSDEAAVRRRFSDRNRVWLVVLLLFFTVVSFVEAVVGHKNTPFDVLLATSNFALTAYGLFFMRYTEKREEPELRFTWRVGQWLRANMNAAAITYVCVQFVFLLVFARNGDDWLGWAVSLPWLLLGFRMAVAELVLMHGFVLASSFVMTFLAPLPNTKDTTPFLISMVVIHVLTCGTELFMSRRMRKKVIDEWGMRRTSAREQIRMRDELRYARELQLSMLPDCAPHIEWADICSISVPATEVGGDYYDYFVEDGRVALVCGDVAGHGMAAGLVLSALRSGFTLLRDSLNDPAVVLRRLHDLVAQTSRRRMLVTVSVVLLGRKQATIASAGHPPVILRRADGSVHTIDLFAPPLGVRLPVTIPQRTIDVAPGDVFVLHSDGVYETRSATGEDYGLERLEEVVRTSGGESAEELRDAILADVAAFRGTREAADDVTIVVCRLT